MIMSNGEILSSFRTAKKPSRQVQVLAELNVCSEQEIIDILIAEGVDHRQLPRGKRSDAGKPKPKPKAEPKAEPVEIEQPKKAKPPKAFDVLDNKIVVLLAREADIQLELEDLRMKINALYYAQEVLKEAADG